MLINYFFWNLNTKTYLEKKDNKYKDTADESIKNIIESF